MSQVFEGWMFETKEPNRIPYEARYSISLRRGVGHTRASTAPGIVAATSGGQIVPAFDRPQDTGQAKDSDSYLYIYIYIYVYYIHTQNLSWGTLKMDGWFLIYIFLFLFFLTFGDVQLKDFVLLSWCDIVMYLQE